MPFRIVITDFVTAPLTIEEAVVGDIANIAAANAFSESELVGHVEEADAVMIYHSFNVTRETLARLQRCKIIVRGGVGFDNVDREFARSRGIPVVNVPDYGTEDVADHAIGMALSLSRAINVQNSRLRANIGRWSYEEVAPVLRLRGRKFAIIGFGRIGTATALRAKALGMDVWFYDPYLPDGCDKAIGVRRAETIEELLQDAHIVSLHCPLNESSRHIINARTIALMPAGSYLVNTARGEVVDTSAVPDAISSGHLAGVALDVLPQEPPDPNDPLLVAWRDPAHAAHHRLIINPHSAFYTEEGFADMRVKGSQAVRRALLGQPLRNVVN